jgi:predicted dehydrogenase
MEKIRFATVGTSWITDEFIGALKTFPQAELKGVYSRNEEKAHAFAQKHGAGLAFTSLEEMAKSKEIDAVYIASPNSCHCEQSLLFLNSKKHVICEKPAASNLKEVQMMTAAARDNGVTFMEAYKSIFMPGMKAVKENLHKLGTIRSAFFSFAKYSSRYDAHKEGKNVNTFKAEFSNGALMDLGMYCVAPMLHLFGTPSAISSFAAKVEGGVDGAGALIMGYPTFVATLNYGKVADSHLPCEIAGEEATMLIHHISIPDKTEIIYRDKTKDNEVIIPDQRPDNMCYEIEEFLSCIKEGRSESAIHTHAITEACMEITDEARRQGNIIYPADNKCEKEVCK